MINKIKDIFIFIQINGFFLFLIKGIDKLLVPFGICLSSFYNFRKRQIFGSKKINLYRSNIEIFNDIYENKYWQIKNTSLSGSGSDYMNTKQYSKKLSILLKKFKIKSIFDVPCGDFLWIKKFLRENKKIEYLGGDISTTIISQLKNNHKGYKFINFDLINSKNFPRTDLIHIRDCFIHFSNFDIKKALKNLKLNCKSKYILISSHKSFFLKNYNIKTGDFRIIDLRKKPFNLNNPLYKIKDYRFGQFPKFVFLWKLKDLF